MESGPERGRDRTLKLGGPGAGGGGRWPACTCSRPAACPPRKGLIFPTPPGVSGPWHHQEELSPGLLACPPRPTFASLHHCYPEVLRGVLSRGICRVLLIVFLCSALGQYTTLAGGAPGRGPPQAPSLLSQALSLPPATPSRAGNATLASQGGREVGEPVSRASSLPARAAPGAGGQDPGTAPGWQRSTLDITAASQGTSRPFSFLYAPLRAKVQSESPAPGALSSAGNPWGRLAVAAGGFALTFPGTASSSVGSC